MRVDGKQTNKQTKETNKQRNKKRTNKKKMFQYSYKRRVKNEDEQVVFFDCFQSFKRIQCKTNDNANVWMENVLKVRF